MIFAPACGCVLSPIQTIHLLQKTSKKQWQKIAQKSRSKTGPPEEGKNNIVCKMCSHTITSASHGTTVAGNHQHTCTNPKGISYTIRCFSAAPGCLNHGNPALDFTWFAGYAWNYSICSHCFSHLGWFFQSDNHAFFGLISDHLEQEKSQHK